MFIDIPALIATLIALLGSIVVITLAIRQNIELQRDNINLRRKLNIERIARDIRN